MTNKKLRKYTLTFNEKKDRWDLTNDSSNQTVKTFETKVEATTGGVLRTAVGRDGGSIKIQKVNGRFQEERTYPSDKDSHSSRG
jgi:hypothetical protein